MTILRYAASSRADGRAVGRPDQNRDSDWQGNLGLGPEVGELELVPGRRQNGSGWSLLAGGLSPAIYRSVAFSGDSVRAFGRGNIPCADGLKLTSI